MWNWTVGTKRGTDQPQKSFSNGNTAFKSDIRPNIKPAFFVFTVSAWALISLWVYRHREGRILACPLCTSSMSLLPVCKATHGWIQSCSFPGNWSLRQDGNGKMKNLIEEILLFSNKNFSQENNKHCCSLLNKKKRMHNVTECSFQIKRYVIKMYMHWRVLTFSFGQSAGCGVNQCQLKMLQDKVKYD